VNVNGHLGPMPEIGSKVAVFGAITRWVLRRADSRAKPAAGTARPDPAGGKCGRTKTAESGGA
jgi:hypothetical protein